MPRKDRDTALTPTMEAAMELLRDGAEIEETWHGTYINGTPAGQRDADHRITGGTMEALRRRGLIEKDGSGLWRIIE